jgi:hypothetical protein
MAYLDCPSCGQKAPKKATRCPECGLIFTAGIRQHSIARPGLKMLRRGLIVAGAVGVLAVAVGVFQGRDRSSAFIVPPPTSGEGLEPQPIPDDTVSLAPAQEEQTIAAPPPPPTRQAPTPTPTPTPAPPRDTAPASPSQPIAQTRDSVGDSAPSVAQALPLDTTPVIESRPEPAPVVISDSAPAAAPPAGAQLQRYARTWVSIREGRSDSAPAVRTLEPGEAVLVDSLSQGWYRVVADGQPVGYVDGGYLDVEAP